MDPRSLARAPHRLGSPFEGHGIVVALRDPGTGASRSRLGPDFRGGGRAERFGCTPCQHRLPARVSRGSKLSDCALPRFIGGWASARPQWPGNQPGSLTASDTTLGEGLGVEPSADCGVGEDRWSARPAVRTATRRAPRGCSPPARHSRDRSAGPYAHRSARTKRRASCHPTSFPSRNEICTPATPASAAPLRAPPAGFCTQFAGAGVGQSHGRAPAAQPTICPESACALRIIAASPLSTPG